MSTTKITTAPQPLEEVAKINGLVDDLSALNTALTAAIVAAKQAAKEEMFPVGSMYVNYLPTNPAELLGFGTWTQASTTLVTSVASTAPVKGTGMTLGLTDGARLGATVTSSGGAFTGIQNEYGKPVGTSTSQSSYFQAGKGIGVTNDASKSGLVADTSSLASKLTVYVWFRTE